MPIYEYTHSGKKYCTHCRGTFESMQSIKADPLKWCPRCGAPVKRVLSAPSVGGSESKLDDRAKASGFHKLKKLGKGEYEKQY